DGASLSQIRRILPAIGIEGILPPEAKPPARMARLSHPSMRVDDLAARFDLRVVEFCFWTCDIGPIIFDIGFNSGWPVLAIAADPELAIKMRIGCAVPVAEL